MAEDKYIDLGYTTVRTRSWLSNTIDGLLGDEKVLDESELLVNFCYPFLNPVVINLESPSGNGFTRAELSEIIMKQIYEIYQDESQEPTVPLEQLRLHSIDSPKELKHWNIGLQTREERKIPFTN